MVTRRNQFWMAAVIFLCLSLPCSPGAQETKQEAVTLEDMVVTATKSKKEIKDTPAGISIIKGDDIDTSSNMTLDEAFRYTPSVQIIRGEGIATVHNFTNIRGIGEKRNLLYIDGVNMVESMSGNTNLSFLPTDGIDRIEILRGPSSALYGGRGMSGVINIMSKPPEPGWHAGLRPAFGNYNYQKYQGKASYGGEDLSVEMNYTDTRTDNYWVRDTLIRRDYDYRTGTYSYDNDSDYEKEGHKGWENWNRDYEERALRSKFYYHPGSAANIALTIGVMDNNTGNGYTDRYTDAQDNDVEKYLEKEKAYIGLTGETAVGREATLSYRLTYHNPESRIVGENMDLSLSLDDSAQLAPGGRAPRFYRSESIQGSEDYEAEVKWAKPFSGEMLGKHMVTLGAEYIRNDIYWSIEETGSGRELTTEVDETKDAWSIYVQDEYFISDRFTLTAGLRGDFYEDFDDQLSPKVSLLYNHNPATQYYISGGYAYNPPPYSQKFGTDWNMTAYSIRTNNEELDAEKIVSGEVGVRKAIGKKVYGSLSAYYAEADDLIESIKERRQVGGADSEVYMTYEYHDNIDRATMKGVESEINIMLAAHHRISGALTYMHAVNEETGNRLEKSPHWLGSLAYHYHRPWERYRFWTTVRGRGQDKFYLGEFSVDEPRKVSGFLICDLSVGVDIGKYFSLFADATNLFDQDYREFTYTRYQPGRMWLIGGEIRI